MSSGEIINLQFGNFSNYVGAHWLNSQVGDFKEEGEFDWNVLWRKPYHPRLVTVDFKSNYFRRRQRKVTKEEVEVTGNWDGVTERVDEEEEEEDSTKEGWRDLVSWQSKNVSLPNSSVDTLEHFSQGRRLFSSVQEELEDSVRAYAEECDRLQGLHLLSDVDGFGGVSSGMLELVCDDYEKKTCLSFALAGPSLTNSDFRLRAMNSVLLISSLHNHSSVFSCLSPFLNMFQQQPTLRTNIPLKGGVGAGEWSEWVGTTLDTLTAPYCLRTRESVSALDVAGLLNAHGRKMSVVAAAVPLATDKSLFETLNEFGLPLSSLTPEVVDVHLDNSFANFIVPRGFHNIQPKEMKTIATTAKSCVQLYADESFTRSLNIVAPVNTPTPRHGSCVVVASNGSDASAFLSTLMAEAKNKRTVKVSKAVLTVCDVMEADDYDESLNILQDLLEKYK